MRKYLKGLFSLTALLILSAPLQAHFPWLIVDEDGKAALFFGEGLADRAYHMPDSVAACKVYAETKDGKTALTLVPKDTQGFVGLVSKTEADPHSRLSAQATYGVYHGNRLIYYASHIPGELETAWSSSDSHEGLWAEAVATQHGVDIYVRWNGQPLTDAEVKLFSSDGSEQGEAATDSDGKVSFSSSLIKPGLNGIICGHTVSGDSGKLGDAPYDSTMHYCTMTFKGPERFAVSRQASERSYAELPYEITSFGAVRVGDTAYVYGGHTGDAHSYSTEEQSNELLALDLSDPGAKWTAVATGERLQGLAMVPHKTSIVLIGGFTARNKRGEEHDLDSRAQVRAFDTQTKSWVELPSLPAGRSSHDAAIIGDTVYVVGGWDMQGAGETQWHDSAWKLDLSAAEPQWQELPKPPFERRALAAVAHQGLLYVIGGMDHAGGPTRKVDIYDPSSETWMSGPELPGQSPMAGFGAAGWSVGGRLMVSTYEGDVVLLAEDGDSWKSIGKSEDSRFFHRLIPIDASQVLAVGGANMESGKFLKPEVLSVN